MKRNSQPGSPRVLDATAPRTRTVRQPVSAPATGERFSSSAGASARGSGARVVAAADAGRRPALPSTRPSESSTRTGRGVRFAGVGAAAVAVVGVAMWGASSLIGAVTGDDDVHSGAPAPATAAAPTTAAAVSDGPCSPGEGDQSSGEGVIAALEHRYYLLRDGGAVRELMATDAPLPDAATIQLGIDSVPLGTMHCLEVTAIGPNTYSAQITEIRPDRRNEFKQRITTTTGPDGRVMIRSIEEVRG